MWPGWIYTQNDSDNKRVHTDAPHIRPITPLYFFIRSHTHQPPSTNTTSLHRTLTNTDTAFRRPVARLVPSPPFVIVRNSFSMKSVCKPSNRFPLSQLHIFFPLFTQSRIDAIVINQPEVVQWTWLLSGMLVPLKWTLVHKKSVAQRYSVVDIPTGYGLDDWEVGVRVPVGSRINTSPCRPDRLWGPHNLLYNGYRELFPGGKAAEAWSWPFTSS
jgi:hypothetical protein